MSDGCNIAQHLGYETPIGERLYDKQADQRGGDVAQHSKVKKSFMNGGSDA